MFSWIPSLHSVARGVVDASQKRRREQRSECFEGIVCCRCYAEGTGERTGCRGRKSWLGRQAVAKVAVSNSLVRLVLGNSDDGRRNSRAGGKRATTDRTRDRYRMKRREAARNSRMLFRLTWGGEGTWTWLLRAGVARFSGGVVARAGLASKVWPLSRRHAPTRLAASSASPSRRLFMGTNTIMCTLSGGVACLIDKVWLANLGSSRRTNHDRLQDGEQSRRVPTGPASCSCLCWTAPKHQAASYACRARRNRGTLQTSDQRAWDGTYPGLMWRRS